MNDTSTRGSYELQKGQHLLIDCRGVPRDLCLNDQLLLESMAEAARAAGATVISQIRYQFGNGSPAGCTAIVMLDESHCSVHTYADLGLMAMDIFTCGETSPEAIWKELSERLQIWEADVRMVNRFDSAQVPQI
ncbi:MAG: S-adenosylmethionine decarboxylase [Candidatus Krumholzibacteriia bacterium]|jgi:S-adenosylmethionine decarboxylase